MTQTTADPASVARIVTLAYLTTHLRQTLEEVEACYAADLRATLVGAGVEDARLRALDEAFGWPPECPTCKA